MNTLASEHLADLRKSGLTDATITALKCQALRPADIKLHGVESAYELRYFHLDGSVNGFARWKLFPPIKTRKYHQPVESHPHLYLPPLLDWQALAADATQSMAVTEGEKKGAALCQQGIAGAAIGGAWNFRQRLDSGERLVIPTLDLFVWKDRMVDLVPDSDAWREDKQMVLGGFFALGQELISRGAIVRLLRLPERSARKVGVDDWLLQAGEDWKTLWPTLERLALDDERLAPVARWWQSWREKHVVEEALRTQDAEAMEHQQVGGLHTISFPTSRVRFQFDRLNEERGDVKAELTVMLGQRELIGETNIGLKSNSGREAQARTLKTLSPSLPWKRLIERACTTVLKSHRLGKPIVVLQPAASAHVPFTLNPLIYQNHQSLFFAPGGSCKSYFALYLAMLASHGASQNGLAALGCPVLYLDWELNEETVGGRLKTLQTGHPELAEFSPYYRPCEIPLHQEANSIAKQVAERGVKLLIVDSAAMACGGDLNSPDTVVKFTRALKTIGCSSLLLAHVSKNPHDEKSAFGSIYFRELARNVWEMERVDDDGEGPVTVALFNKKNNFGRKHPPLAFAFTFKGESVRIEASDPTKEPAFETKLPLVSRIRNLLEDGTPRTSKDIAETLEAKLSTVTVALSRGQKLGKWTMIGNQKDAKWTVLSR